jgi:lipoprotein LprG
VRARAAVVILGILLAGCGGGADQEASADVAAVIDLAAQTMGGITSAAFAMRRTGAPVEISDLRFDSAEGVYSAPASAKAILQVKAADISVELGTIAIGERVWLTNPLTGQWEEIPAGSGFNIAVVFDPDVGWVPLLTEDLSDIELVGVEGGTYVIHGTIAASRVEFLTAGLVEAQAVEADIWIDGDDGYIERVEFATEFGGAATTWVIEMSGFDEPVTVEPPAGF